MAGGEHGGAEAFFVRLCKSFALRGIEQRALVRPHADREAALRAAGIRAATTAFGGPFDLASTRRFRSEIETFAPDIVLTWMNRATRFCPRHGRDRTRFVHVGRLGGYYDLKYYRNCDHLIGNTEDIVDYMRGRGWPGHRAHYLPNFVTAGAAPPVDRMELGLAAEGPLLLALGRFHANKAFDVLLSALARVPEAVLCLAGAGPLERELRAQAAGLGIEDRVAFPGWRKDVGPLFAAADLCVCPSRLEPLGNVVIESWAHGVPVVAAAAKGPTGLIEDGRNGSLVPVDDAGALADAIRRILGDRDMAAGLARAGNAAYEARFTESAVTGEYLGLFERLMTGEDAA